MMEKEQLFTRSKQEGAYLKQSLITLKSAQIRRRHKRKRVINRNRACKR